MPSIGSCVLEVYPPEWVQDGAVLDLDFVNDLYFTAVPDWQPSWVMFGAALDLDFVNDRYFNG